MKFLQRMKHPVCAAVLCGTLLFGGAAEAEQTGMDAFKEAMTMNMEQDNRIFREQIVFFLPDVNADIDFQAVAHNKKDVRMEGNFSFVMTNEKGNTVTTAVPFYLDQSGTDMLLYFKTGKEWQKFKAPLISASAVDALGTPTEVDIQNLISLVKSAEVLKDTDSQRTMLLHLDQNAFTLELEKFYTNDTEGKQTEEDKAFQEIVSKYLKQGIQNSDVWCTWTVDKKDWQTITLAVNLSSLIQETAKAVLNDSSVTLDPFSQHLLESLAYYSELKAYTTYLNPDTKSRIDIPKEVLKAKETKEKKATTPANK